MQLDGSMFQTIRRATLPYAAFFDVTAKTPNLSFGGSQKSGNRNFSGVTALGSTRKIPNFGFFEIHSKSIVVTFSSHVFFRNGMDAAYIPQRVADL